MYILINNKKYNTWDSPQFGKKRNDQVVLTIYDNFSGPIDDIIIVCNTSYSWIFKGCQLKRIEDTSSGPFFSDKKVKRTTLTLSYKERSGSHLPDVIKSEIRDWKLKQIIS